MCVHYTGRLERYMCVHMHVLQLYLSKYEYSECTQRSMDQSELTCTASAFPPRQSLSCLAWCLTRAVGSIRPHQVWSAREFHPLSLTSRRNIVLIISTLSTTFQLCITLFIYNPAVTLNICNNPHRCGSNR